MISNSCSSVKGSPKLVLGPIVYVQMKYFNHLLSKLIERQLILCVLETTKGYFANSEDPDEMQHKTAFHQCLHCLLR